MGKVLLVGAGPGDPDLLTVKALKALQSADIILFDDLVHRPILDLARPGAKRICVGKRAGRQSWGQEEINRLMVRLAGQCDSLVRLKSGDPSVFGRSGEEIAALAAAGLEIEVVPGITTASALAADLSLSLTHRACARSLRFVTAHGAKGGLPPDLDWRGLADPVTTLIVYMGGRTGPELAARLIAQGRAARTPVILAENVSRPDRDVRLGTLGDLAAGHLKAQRQGPVILGIGETFTAAGGAAQLLPAWTHSGDDRIGAAL